MKSQVPGPSNRPDRVGPYRIEDQLGAGGMGAVYRAWDERLKRPVAMKHILPEVDDPLLRDRFRREAQAAASLNHSSIVHIYDIVEEEQGDWIVMELVEGARLDRLLRLGPLELVHALRYGRQVARGLEEAHSKGIIHRDLKVENVMITRGGRAKILDFGLAKFFREVKEPDLSTTQGAVMGTARIMSPEQAMGLEMDHRSDLFSLGTMLYEMVTGSSPFKADAVVETLKRVCTWQQAAAFELRDEIPDELSELIDHLLAKDPELRPQSARQVVRQLVRIAESRLPESLKDQLPESDVLEIHEIDEIISNEPSDASDSRGATTVPHRLLAARDREPESSGRPSSGRLSSGRLSSGRPSFVRPVPAADSRSVSSTRVLDATVPKFARFQPLGERRQVTVLCCDLLGEDSDGEFGVLDPERLYEVMPEFRAVARESISCFSGHLGKILGHRLWAYFGYPQAHEDDAERAVRAALDLVDRVRWIKASDSSGAVPMLGLRAGIHTGPAVVTRIDPSEDDIALGSTLEQTAGIHELAVTHGVVVSEETRRLIDRSFVTKELDARQPRGFNQPHAAHRVLSTRNARARFEGGGSPGPLVGRKAELTVLLELWDRCLEDSGHAVFLSGEAGIGKSRLVKALGQRLASSTSSWWITSASPFTRNSPLYPVVEMIRGWLQVEPGESSFASGPLEDLLRSRAGSRNARHLRPALRRSKILAALVDFFIEKATYRPTVLVVEDLQWADPSTLEFLDLLLKQVSTARLLLILTFRPDFETPWPPRPDIVPLGLAPLGPRESAQLVDRVSAARPLPPEIRRQVVARTDGIPVFIEELTKSLMESGLGDPNESATDFLIPTTLRDSLTARLDRLGSAKVLAQRAAVIGRKFSRDLLALVVQGEQGLEEAVARLMKAELIHRDPASPGFLMFRHALIQEVAYGSLLKQERRGVHLVIARALEDLGDDEGVPPEVVARHYTRARHPEPAARCWLVAGQRALERSAHVEAVEHLRKGLKVLGALAPGVTRDWLEFSLECVLIPALNIRVDQGLLEGDEVVGLSARVRDLCQRICDRDPARAVEAREGLNRALQDSPSHGKAV